MNVPRKRKREIILPTEAQGAEHIFFAELAATVGVGISTGKLRIPNVLCAVREKMRDGSRAIHIFPTVRQAKRLQHSSLVAIKGTYNTGNGSCAVEAGEVWCDGIRRFGWQNFTGYSGLTGNPETLRITQKLLGSRKGNEIDRGSFQLSEIPVVNAAAIVSRSYTGNVRVRRITTPTFTLASGIRISFVRHYYHQKTSDTTAASSETTTSSELSAEFRTLRKIGHSEFREAETDFEDFLLITSLAARYRCSFSGWEYSAGRTLVKHEYFNRIKPSLRIPSINETLIDIVDFPAFVRKAYRTYRSLPNRELVERAIQTLTAERGFLEDRYVSLFAGLQSLLWFSYRSGGGTETRVSIKKLFSLFVQSRQIELGDLWPLFDETNGASLYKIRNAIAHGEYLPPQKVLAISYAAENLSWTLERMLLCVLGWPLEKSKVRPESLRTWLGAIDWKKECLNW
jgi:hypothetical protein